MTGEFLERIGPMQYRCSECGGVSATRLPNHDLDCPVVTGEIAEEGDE
jgi:hypothetical protein